jgi:hypothetical protein
VPSNTEWAFGATGLPFTPNVFVPLSVAHMNRKDEAWRCYESEQRSWPHPRCWHRLVSLAEWRGSQCGHDHAEAFMLVREVVAP